MKITSFKNFKSIDVNPIHHVFLIRFFLLTLLTIWITGFLLPLITTIKNPLTNFVITRFYSTVCHQEGFKCISINNSSMLVCARCAGIYFGALIAAVSSLFIIRSLISKRFLLISILPLVTDVFLISLGIYPYSKSLAFVTGIIFGSTIYYYIIAEIEKLSLKQIFNTGNE